MLSRSPELSRYHKPTSLCSNNSLLLEGGWYEGCGEEEKATPPNIIGGRGWTLQFNIRIGPQRTGRRLYGQMRPRSII